MGVFLARWTTYAKGIPMTGNFHFFVVNRDRKTTLRYELSFVPRVGDTFEIGGFYLKVLDVVIVTAKFSGEGKLHSLYIHVKETKIPFDVECEELEFDDFCDRMKQQKPPRPRVSFSEMQKAVKGKLRGAPGKRGNAGRGGG